MSAAILQVVIRTPAGSTPDRHYDAVTRAWRLIMGDSFHYGCFDYPQQPLEAATRALTERMASRGRIGTGDRVLDVGCGIGAPAMWLVRERGCRVEGISTSTVGVKAANEAAEAASLAGELRFRVRDGMENGYPDASFDRVWVMESSHLMPDKAKLLNESARVLRPGGRLVLCDIVVHRDLPISEVLRRARTFDVLRRVFGRAKMETLDAYAGWLVDAGICPDVREDLTAATAATFDRWRENVDRHRAAINELIGAEACDEFRDACEELEGLWRDGTLGYGLIAGGKPAGTE